jgi:hypothetical protein
MSYSPTLGVWTKLDPGGYVDGSNLYEIEKGNPVASVDPTGLNSVGIPGGYTPPGYSPAPAPIIRPVHLPGGPGKTLSDIRVFTVPGIGEVTIYVENNHYMATGGSANLVAKITKADGCPCWNLRWSQQVKITINNRASIAPKILKGIIAHESDEHAGNNPLVGWVLDNDNDTTGKPNLAASLLDGKDWPKGGGTFHFGDIGFGDWPMIPWAPAPWKKLPYPKGADVTKEFILTPTCDGKPLGLEIHWTVHGVAGSGETATVDVEAMTTR